MDYYFLDKDGENSKCETVDVGKGKDFPKEIVYPSSAKTEVSSSCSDNNKFKVDEMEEVENSSNMDNSPGEKEEALASSDEQIMRIISESHDDVYPGAEVSKSGPVQENESAYESTTDSILKNVIDTNFPVGTHEENEPVSENVETMSTEENSEPDEALPALDHTTSDEESSKSNLSSEVASSQDKIKIHNIFDSFCNENSDVTTSQGSSFSDTSNKEEKESSGVPENSSKSKKIRRNNNFDVNQKNSLNIEEIITDTNIKTIDHDREISVATEDCSTKNKEEKEPIHIESMNLRPDSHEEKELIHKESMNLRPDDHEEKELIHKESINLRPDSHEETELIHKESINIRPNSHEKNELLHKESKNLRRDSHEEKVSLQGVHQDSEKESQETETKDHYETIQETKDIHEANIMGTSEDSHESVGLEIKENIHKDSPEDDGLGITEDSPEDDGLGTREDSPEDDGLGITEDSPEDDGLGITEDSPEDDGLGTREDSPEDDGLGTREDSPEDDGLVTREDSPEGDGLGTREDSPEGDGLGTTEDGPEDNRLGTTEDNGFGTTEDSCEANDLGTTEDSCEGNDLGTTDDNNSIVEGVCETGPTEKFPSKEKVTDHEVAEEVDKFHNSDDVDMDFREETEVHTKINDKCKASPDTSLELPDNNNKRDLTEGEGNIIKKFKAGIDVANTTFGTGSNFKIKDTKEGECDKRDSRKEVKSKECDETTAETTAGVDSRDVEKTLEIQNTVNGLEHKKVTSFHDAKLATQPKSGLSDSSESHMDDSSDTHMEITKQTRELEKKLGNSKCEEMNVEDASQDKISRSEETLEESSNLESEADDKEQKKARNFDTLISPDNAESKACNVPEENQDNTGDAYLDYDEESIENISRTIRSFSNEKPTPKTLENRNQKETSVSKRVIIVKTAPNVEKVKRKLEEILERSKGEEDAAIAELQRMKREKTEILNAITTEMEKLKSMLVKGKQG